MHADKPIENDLHPTMKPNKLIADQIRNSSRVGEIVLDLFGGSGTTLICAEQLHRTCYAMEYDPKYVDVIIAAPIKKDAQLNSKVLNDVRAICEDAECPLIINGTGKFVKHGPIADSGTTGRKLAVDFYGGSCRIGGGSPWTKDGTKADLTLNLYARYLALKFLKDNDVKEPVFCDIACAIGSRTIDICLHSADGIIFKEYTEEKSPKELIKFFKLDKPIYAEMCRNGLFARI